MTYEYEEIANEQQLFNFINKHFIKDLKPSELPTSRFDCYSEKYKLDIELKCRRKHYDELIIERGKYDALMHRCEVNGSRPVYINSTPKGICGFYLDKHKLEWEHKDLTKQTDFSDRQTISKEIGYLDTTKGINLLSLLPIFPL